MNDSRPRQPPREKKSDPRQRNRPTRSGDQEARGSRNKRRGKRRPRRRGDSPSAPQAGGTQEPTPASGVLEIQGKGFGFLRKLENCYQPDPGDVFISSQLIDRYRLQTGSQIQGMAAFRKGKQEIQSIELIDGTDPATYADRKPFSRMISIDPFERFQISETGNISMRILDLMAPIGKGQRSLIVAPPRTGKTMLLQQLAAAVVQFHPEVHLIVMLVDERPEEVTEMRRSVPAEVVYSSNDESPRRHVRVVEMVLERARRLVESGKDVVVLLDSLTRVARAYNSETRGRGRTLSGGLDARTMEKPREFFGAARKIEDGASLTIIATALVDTGSRMDDIIFEEFKGTGNMELVLHRTLADRRVWPAIDIQKSGTRKEEKLRSPEDQQKINLLRRALADQKAEDALSLLRSKLEQTATNQEFLARMKV